MKPYPPLGILYICSHLRKKGVNAEVFDSTFSSREDLWKMLAARAAVGHWNLCQPHDAAECGRDPASSQKKQAGKPSLGVRNPAPM